MTSESTKEALEARLVKGYQVASGQSKNSPYPAGSIKMQAPIFAELGVDLSNFYLATLNLDISPSIFKMNKPKYELKQVNWTELSQPEDFSLSPCLITHQGEQYQGLIYYPHPDTKPQHFHSNSLIEVIAEFIPDIQYGDSVSLNYHPEEIEIN